MNNDLLDNDFQFRRVYFENLANRFANASLDLEGESEDFANSKLASKLYLQADAIDYAFRNAPSNDENLGRGIIDKYINYYNEINKRVTDYEYDGFRTGFAIVNGSNVQRSEAKYIMMHMRNLIEDYLWRKDFALTIEDPEKRLDYIFETLASFHIRFLHIHPYGDGNGRTARIILMKDLLSFGLAPCVISKATKEEYNDLIEHSDIPHLKEMFRNLSNNEEVILKSIYDKVSSGGSRK